MRSPLPCLGALCLALALVVDGCRSSTAEGVPARGTLNAAAVAGNVDLAGDVAAQRELQRALEATFGSSDAPRLETLAAWRVAGFDPGRWTLDEGGEALRAELAAGNRVWFAAQIAALEAGRPEDVETPAWAPDLRRDWTAHLEQRPEGGRPSWRQAAVELFVDYYPELAASAAVFRGRCARCHGLSGGGDGPLAERLRTRPRDYRRGIFKRTPLADRARPRQEDLARTIAAGIPGTAMPSFAGRLAPSQLAGLADYVRLLSIRGETELLTIFDYDAEDGVDAQTLRDDYALVVDRWRTAGEHLILASEPPSATPERIAHGRELFHREGGANCARCHGSEGHGDGPASYVGGSAAGELRSFEDDWGHPIRPRDLVCAPLRFGDRPVDIYHRLHAGINGTPMPAHHGFLATERDGSRHQLEEADLWDLVFYVESLRKGETKD